jgi:hypothetical protein
MFAILQNKNKKTPQYISCTIQGLCLCYISLTHDTLYTITKQLPKPDGCEVSHDHTGKLSCDNVQSTMTSWILVTMQVI